MTLAAGDLTTLLAAKGYIEPTPSDAIISGLITRVSMMIRSTINRPFLLPRAYVRQFDGTGTETLVLPDYPLIGSTLTSLTVGGSTISLAPQPANDVTVSFPGFGYRFQPWDGLPPGMPAVVELLGTAFWSGHQNVVASYTAGYQVTNEAQTIPATPFQVTPGAPFGSWATDQGVTFAATGQALTAIASGTPTSGQYLPPAPDAGTPRAFYTFAAADTGKAILLSYGFVPADLEQVALELIAERASYRRRVGLRSQSLASQESFTFDDRGISQWAVNALNPYMSPLPPPIGVSV
jgi:hypothetical protein